VRLDVVPASPQTANCHRSHPSNLLAFRKLGTRACQPRRDGFRPWATLPLARVCYYRGGCSVGKRPPRKHFRCLPPAYRAQHCLRDGSTKPLILLVGGSGIEPLTPSMSRLCSTRTAPLLAKWQAAEGFVPVSRAPRPGGQRDAAPKALVERAALILATISLGLAVGIEEPVLLRLLAEATGARPADA
jgi:hypothetical protein